MMQGWQGPLPSPEALRAFEDVHPGAALLIVQEFQAEAAHRRTQEDREARLRVRETHIGQACAIVFGLAGFAVTAFAASVGAQWVGAIVGGGMILGGVVAFLKGRPR